MAFTPAKIFDVQWVSNSISQLRFFPNGGGTIPSGSQYQINVAWASNTSTADVTLTFYRVPNGAPSPVNDVSTMMGPPIVIPPASLSTPSVPLVQLWGIQLTAGDTIWATASQDLTVLVTADGGINT